MNLKELEALLREIRASHNEAWSSHKTNLSNEQMAKIDHAIKWCVGQQNSKLKRMAEFRFKAAERREALR